MKLLITTLALFGVLATAILASQTVYAQGALSEAHVERIRQNCVSAQTTLLRIHTNDTLLRVNRGQLYELISTKLMAPLNSRIALGRFEGLQLAATTIDYDRQREIFTADYLQYDDAMTRAIKINCTERPSEFYETLQLARERRYKLHEDTKALTVLLESYKGEFESFAGKFDGGSQ